MQATHADRLDTEVRTLRQRLSELEFLRSRVEELRAENHLLLETKQELEDQLQSRDHDMASVAAELVRYKQLLERSNEVRH